MYSRPRAVALSVRRELSGHLAVYVLASRADGLDRVTLLIASLLDGERIFALGASSLLFLFFAVFEYLYLPF